MPSFFTGIGTVVEAEPDRHVYTIEMLNGIRQRVFMWHIEPLEDRRLAAG